MPIRSLHLSTAGITFGLAALIATTAGATEPDTALPQPVTLASIMTLQDPDPSPATVESADLPASMTNPSGIIPLATGGPFVFDALPTRGSCMLRPDVRCTGPDYCGCSPRVYYGTNPCDDDPVLTMSPNVCDAKTAHWYTKAWNMVTRKKAIAEAINH